MSLLATRPPGNERSSVALPHVTCSSCSASIPLSSLGEHLCRPTIKPANVSRSAPRPSQITIPAVSSSSRGWGGQSHSSSSFDANPPRPAFAGPSSARSSPSSISSSQLMLPEGNSPGLGRLSPMSVSSGPFPGRSPSPHTPSPTNPFFPQIHVEDKNGPVTYGLGLTVPHRPEGPFPTDAPLPAGISDLSNFHSGGNSGMAGVGRRAFQAAAWGVTAGISMASAAAKARQEPSPQFRQGSEQPTAQYPQRSNPQPPPQLQTQTQWQPQPRSAGPHPQSNPPPNHQPRSAGPQPTNLAPWQQQRDRNPSPREPQIPPKAPLSGRQRSGTISNGSQAEPVGLRPAMPQRSASAMDRPSGSPNPATSPPMRSASAMSNRPKQPTQPHTRRPSVASTTSSRSSFDQGDSIAQLLKARTNERKGSAEKPAFFEKYKEMQRSNSKDSTNRLLLGGTSSSRKNSIDEGYELKLVDSPQQTTIKFVDEYDDEDGEGSALPWATPALALADSPDIKQMGAKETLRDTKRLHHRYPTAESESSSHSSASSRSGRGLNSGPESEEVVTPSQSFEGLSLAGRRDHRPLKEILESDEDEGDRVVFGGSHPHTHNHSHSHSHSHSHNQSNGGGLPRSGSNSTIVSKATTTTHNRSRTTPTPTSSSSSSSSHTRRVKTCQKCGVTVGGSRKFVERDGVVLCESDWKKMYLPTCRKCNLLIENKMVSADDGQLKGKWHSSCFTCTRCDQGFDNGDFYVFNGKPWCQYHYAEETGTLCAAPSCRRPIEGECILTQGSQPQRFHPGHLMCERKDCREDMDEYYEVGGRKYCERHVRDLGASDGGRNIRAEKRKTRLVDLPRGF